MKTFGKIVAIISVFLCIFGGVGIYKGWEERKLAAKSTPDPIAVDLAKIEAGDKPATNYLKIGPHYAYYSEMVAWSETKNGVTSIKHSYYPIVSSSHPDVKVLEEKLAKIRSEPNTPDQDMPKLHNFVVVVKTTRYKTEAEFKNEQPFAMNQSAQGMVINDIETLKEEEKNLIKKSIPEFDESKILILELDRKPMSATTALAIMFGGLGGLVVGAIGFLGGMFMYIRA